MTTYWADPYLGASSQGNGTTDTSTRNGTYAAPFGLQDIVLSSSTKLTSINGVSLSDNDEVRIKGHTFSTLFETQGNVYEANTNGDADGKLYPITGNSTFSLSSGNPTSDTAVYAFQNSDISSYLPNWTHPLFFARHYDTSTSYLEHSITPFTYAVLKLQLGYTDASSAGMELFKLKDAYKDVFEISSHHYIGNFGVDIHLSAGWTSETAQNGYSILDVRVAGSYDYFYVGGASGNKCYFDLERLSIFYSGSTSSSSGYFYMDPNPCTDGGTGVNTMPVVSYSGGWSIRAYSGPTSIDIVYPAIFGGHGTLGYNTLTIYHTSHQTLTFKNLLLTAHYYFLYESIDINQTSSVNSIFEWGNMYCGSKTETIGGMEVGNFFAAGTSYSGATHTFLQNSVYFLLAADTFDEVTLQGLPDFNDVNIYQSGVKRPGEAPLSNLSTSSSYPNYYGPDFGQALTNSSPLFLLDSLEISTNNSWTTLLGRGGPDAIRHTSLGKLVCGGNDFRTTTHNIKVITPSAISSTAAPGFGITSAEHNDFDGRPISILNDPYDAGISYGVLLYNDTVSSTDVLVGQWSGTTGGESTKAWIPLDLAVPSYTAASDNLRAKVVVAYADGSSNSAAGSILLRAWHRDTTQSANFRVYSSSATTVTAGGDPTSPTTVTLNLSNVPTSGQDDITTVCLGIRLDFTDNTNIQKYYIVSADIETY